MFTNVPKKEDLLAKASQQKKRPPGKSAGAVQAVSKSLGNVEEDNRKLKAMISDGHQAIKIKTDLIEPSFIRDRMYLDGDEEFDTLVASIKESGQQVPILVRPSLSTDFEYQVSYGHRRWLACKSLGIDVLAIVRELTDEQLLIAQGQENHERKNLSYLETALFCNRLKEDYPQKVIREIVGKSKSAVSMYLSLASNLPAVEILEKIGPAPSIGRTRWEEFAELWIVPSVEEKIRTAIETFGSTFSSKPSDQRFSTLLEIARKADNDLKPKRPNFEEFFGSKNEVRYSESRDKLSFDLKVGDRELAAHIKAHLGKLIQDYHANQGD